MEDDMNTSQSSDYKSVTPLEKPEEIRSGSLKSPVSLQASRQSKSRSFKELITPVSLKSEPTGASASLSKSLVPAQTGLNSHADQSLIGPSMEKQLIAYNHLTYFLYLISFFTAGLLWIVPIVMNYMRRSDAGHSWLATHFDWQIKTFWYSVVGGLIGIILILIGAGGSLISLISIALSGSSLSGSMALSSFGMITFGSLTILISYLWHLYRLIKGWIALSDKRAVS